MSAVKATPWIVRPPLPLIMPAKVPDAFDSVRVFEPSVTPPAPDSVVIEVPLLVRPEMSKVPASATPFDEEIEPVTERPSVPPLIVVAPV